jgi:serine/threonine protein kinase
LKALCSDSKVLIATRIAQFRFYLCPEKARGLGGHPKDGEIVMKQFPEIPGYRIIKKLGQGGMADVFLGVQENLDREVAIKVLIPSLFRDDQFSARFLKEAQTAARLVHPNIITIHDVGKVKDCFFIVMEYLQESLSSLMKKHTVLPAKDALGIVKMIALALDYAHLQGFIHRDIKPDNIMFRSDGTVVLVDFGIARAMDSHTQLTRTGMSIGTPHYMSPEQCRGEKIDGRSDIYSLGVQLYELLTGEVPYRAENTAGIILKHIQEPIPQFPEQFAYLQPLLDKMMAKERAERVQTGKELSLFIDAFMNSQSQEFMPTLAITRKELSTMEQPTIPSPTPQAVYTGTQTKSKKKKWLVPTLLLALFVGISITVFVLTRPPVESDNQLPDQIDSQQPLASQKEKTGQPQAGEDTSQVEKGNTDTGGSNTDSIKETGKQGQQGQAETTLKDEKGESQANTTLQTTPKKKNSEKLVNESKEKKVVKVPSKENALQNQLAVDRKYNNYLKQAQASVATGDFDQALAQLAEARKLKNSHQLDDLEKTIKQAQQRRETALVEADVPIKTVTLLGLDPELRKRYNNKLQRIHLDLPRIGSRFKVFGFFTVSMAIDENGAISIRLIKDQVTVLPPRRKRNVKRLILHRLSGITLTPPRDKKGQSVKVSDWRINYKVGKIKSRINLIKQ